MSDSISSFIQLEGATGGEDENKIATFTVSYLVENPLDLRKAGAGYYMGLYECSRTWSANNDGTERHIVTVTYKGHLTKDGKEIEDKETSQWSLDFDWVEEPLESHPKLLEIKASFGGYVENGELVFPELIPSVLKKSAGLGKKTYKIGDKNPMFGAKTYNVMTARVIRTWSSKDIPINSVDDIGKISRFINECPKAISQIDFGDRDWMMMPPKISQHGEIWKIQNEWMLGPVGGWVEEIYQKASNQK